MIDKWQKGLKKERRGEINTFVKKISLGGEMQHELEAIITGFHAVAIFRQDIEPNSFWTDENSPKNQANTEVPPSMNLHWMPKREELFS